MICGMGYLVTLSLCKQEEDCEECLLVRESSGWKTRTAEVMGEHQMQELTHPQTQR
jgi:hypothetical protein